MTLIELLIGLIIMPLVIGGTTVGLITVFENGGAVPNRLSESSDAQFSSTYFARDVQSASSFSTQPAPAPPLCNTGLGTTPFTQTVGLSWNGGQESVSYGFYGAGRLVRRHCQGGSEDDTTVAHNVSGTSASVACSPGPGACPVTASLPSPNLASIRLTVNDQVGSGASLQVYAYSVTAVPRLVTVAGSSLPTGSVPFLLLGTGSGVLTVNGGRLTVNGPVDMVSSDPNAVSGGCGTSCITASGGVNRNASVTDPLQNLSAPSTSGLPVYSGASGYQGPGVYTSRLDISNSQIVFASGTYIFEQGITTHSGDVITCDPAGVFFYIPGGNVQFDGGSINLSPPVTGPYQGVLMFQPDGPYNPNVGGAANANNVNLTSGSVSSLLGTIYAPGATANVTSGGLTLGTIIAKSATLNNGAVTVGP